MTSIPDSLRALFETSIEESNGRYVVSIPKELVDSLSTDEVYRLALLEADGNATSTETETAAEEAGAETETETETRVETPSNPSRGREQGPPVEEGETRSVTIDTLGDKGDGLAKVERGFIVIVPGTKPGDQVDVEITDVKENVAFAEPVSEPTVR